MEEKSPTIFRTGGRNANRAPAVAGSSSPLMYTTSEKSADNQVQKKTIVKRQGTGRRREMRCTEYGSLEEILGLSAHTMTRTRWPRAYSSPASLEIWGAGPPISGGKRLDISNIRIRRLPDHAIVRL